MDRACFSNVGNLRHLANLQMERRPDLRDAAFVSSFPVRGIRGQTTASGERAFVVLDTSLSENTAHASILSAKVRPTPSEVKELKDLLLPFLRTLTPLDAFRDTGKMNCPPVRYVADEFRKLLSEKGFSHRDLATKFDCTENTILNIISGRTAGPRRKMHRKICSVLKQEGIAEDQIKKLFLHTPSKC